MAIPPPPPGSQLLAGSFTIDHLDINLLQWASQVQEVTSHMRWPPEAAVSCPQVDIVSVLDRLEGLTRVRYCRRCFGVGQRCQCSAVPHQAPGLTAALWVPPTASYVAMVSSTETTASTSATGVTPQVTYRLECPLSSPWTRCRLPLRRTCWQLPASAGATNPRPHCECHLPLVSTR